MRGNPELKKFRMWKCLQQKEVAEKAGISLGMYRHYENDVKRIVRLDRQIKIADVLGVEKEKLFRSV